MKKNGLNISVAAFAIVAVISSVSFAAPKFAPYYNLQLTEGISLPSRGDLIFDLNLVNDLGVLARINPEHSVLGFYQIKYTGPGIKRQEGEQFTDRTMDHMFVFRHTWTTPWDMKIKSQFDYWKEFRRSGTNELWGTGLYDMNRVGGLVGAEKVLGEFKVGAALQYHSMLFPNYTDLVAEIRSTGDDVTSSEGKQDHALVQVGATAEWNKVKAVLDLTLQNYFKQKTITNVAQADGTFYSGALQQDSITSIRAGRDFQYGVAGISPEIKWSGRTSNQNYLHFDSVTSTTPAANGFFGNYYSNSQISIALPVIVRITKKWDTFLSWEQEIKSYSDRPARDEDGNFLTDKQSNVSQYVSLGFNNHPNDVTTLTYYYVTQNSSSNMKYEKYFPYNFSAASFGIRFSYQY
ncbi:MAG: hypothetical protein CVU77_08190 [Elusimicrobia bacterium HGW-Elusimicrobia-1]|jgi:hypothetical protein|nr:MAG: hypothetical protein CVU77_08190 [Elusimicrobia bacterium HGW-Elusimicrobia-1]